VPVRKALAPLLAAGAAVLVLAGCGTGGMAHTQGDQQNGGKLFSAKCGGCHQLAAAGSSGTIGPNLDAAFGSDKLQHFEQDTMLNLVLDQIRDPSPPMPAGLVKGQDAVDVAAYVAANAGAKGPEAKPQVTSSADGKTIFKSQCASCHTLADAGTSGKVGPNLDTIPGLNFAIVQHQVENGGGVMPAFKGRLQQNQIDAVAKYVSTVAKGAKQ
jgi:cbb3-type cytochrome c oxidase subunit III